LDGYVLEGDTEDFVNEKVTNSSIETVMEKVVEIDWEVTTVGDASGAFVLGLMELF
jgi:hypothetical protein